MGRDRDRLFHIVGDDDWAALGPDDSYRPASLADEGFVHLSYADQVIGTVDRFYRDLPRPVVVEFTRAGLGAEVIDEDTHGSGQYFPHLYGPVPVAAAVAIHPLRLGRDGGFTWDVALD